MIQVEYAARFLRDYKRLPEPIQEEVLDKIELFRNPKNHSRLHVHRLQGSLKGRLSFSVNFRYRIVFEYIGKNKRTAALITVGDHSIYS